MGLLQNYFDEKCDFFCTVSTPQAMDYLLYLIVIYSQLHLHVQILRLLMYVAMLLFHYSSM